MEEGLDGVARARRVLLDAGDELAALGHDELGA